MHVLTDSLIQVGAQIIHIEHRGRGEDRENLLLGNGPAPTYRHHPRQWFSVKSQRVCTPLPEAARDRTRVSDELADADIGGLIECHKASVPPRTTATP